MSDDSYMKEETLNDSIAFFEDSIADDEKRIKKFKKFSKIAFFTTLFAAGLTGAQQLRVNYLESKTNSEPPLVQRVETEKIIKEVLLRGTCFSFTCLAAFIGNVGFLNNSKKGSEKEKKACLAERARRAAFQKKTGRA